MNWLTSSPSLRKARLALGHRVSAWLGASCVLCDAPGAEICEACNACVRSNEATRLRCRLCADVSIQSPCQRCALEPPPFSRAVCAGNYAPPLDAVERSMKFRARPHAARALAGLLASATRQACLDPHPELLIPVPLASERLAERGFNQAALIAHALAQDLGTPLRLNALRRVRETPALSLMHAEERTSAIRGAFACVENLSGSVVGLVDDVMTTGATLRAASHALRAAGACDVIVLVALRTPAP